MAVLPLALLLLAPLQDPADTDEPAVAARGAGVEVTVDEVDRLLLERHALSQEGRELREFLLKSHLLDALAKEHGVEVGEAEVTRRWKELEGRLRAAGEPGGLAAQLEREGLEEAEFRALLRRSIVQERLTRRALELGPDAEVTATQQETWLAGELAARGREHPAPPFPDGVVARSGDVAVTTEEFARFLRPRLPSEEVREACWHLLLLRSLERRMPDLAPGAYERAVQDVVERRRAAHEREVPGMSFEQRLGAAGRSVERLGLDPAVRIEALTRLWVDRTFGEEGLLRVFEEERATFEGLHGKAARVHLLFLDAGRFKNELMTRTFAEAEAELVRMEAQVGDTADFEALCASFSEEPATRAERGALGWVTRLAPRVPLELREAVFDLLDAGTEVPPEGMPVGPVRLDHGSALLWVSAVRPSPAWDRMREHVHEELRRRLVIDAMPTGAMEILLPTGEDGGG